METVLWQVCMQCDHIGRCDDTLAQLVLRGVHRGKVLSESSRKMRAIYLYRYGVSRVAVMLQGSGKGNATRL